MITRSLPLRAVSDIGSLYLKLNDRGMAQRNLSAFRGGFHTRKFRYNREIWLAFSEYSSRVIVNGEQDEPSLLRAARPRRSKSVI